MSGFSVLVGEKASVFGDKKLPASNDEDDTRDEHGAAVFGSSWLPGSTSKAKSPKEEKKKKRRKPLNDKVALDEDVVEDLVLSSDEDGSMNDSHSDEEDRSLSDGPSINDLSSEEDEDVKPVAPRKQIKKQKPRNLPPKRNVKSHSRKLKKRKRTN